MVSIGIHRTCLFLSYMSIVHVINLLNPACRTAEKTAVYWYLENVSYVSPETKKKAAQGIGADVSSSHFAGNVVYIWE